ncbi:MAG TPA: glycoside hydrolase [Ktedonobacter sp.]|jgi:alpha-amylase/alpha-mannosidase (GH57 family)|nr:glycoside hydrolase [Ktedonobacter sp.]
MIKETIEDSPVSPQIGRAYLCLHGHFYQPPREDPFTGIIPIEPEATPYVNFNEKITAECYLPNAEAGNFASISYDLGPTLASWLEGAHPHVYQQIIAADYQHRMRYGVGNALAQAYNHTILPLANSRDKNTQILWGLQDFRHRYGHDAHGMWLAETAVDLESLDLMAQHGVLYTVLAPWQAAMPIDPTEPYLVHLFNGRSITVFFYNAPLSGGVSFDWNTTSNADLFATSYLPGQLVKSKRDTGEAQLLLIATDGELYGHHKPWRDKFMTHLIQSGAPAYGFEVCTLERYMQMYPATKEVALHVPSAWSCGHGVARWDTGCECTEGDSSWKGKLRSALNHLAECGDQLFEQYAGETLSDPWAARNAYLALRNGWATPESFWAQYGKAQHLLEHPQLAERTRLLLEAQYYHQYSFTSCGFFFENLDRIEPRNDIAFARRAISLTWQALGIDLQRDFLCDLAQAKGWRTNVTGADLYRQLPIVQPALLPPLSQA